MTSQTALDLTQTVTAIGALVGAAYSYYLQRRAMSRSQELAAAATLFEYYNAKISSLRNSIIRDASDPEAAQLESLEVRKARLKELLEAHEKVRTRLEQLYNESAKSS